MTTQVSDQFGNQSEQATQTFAVDETLPTVTISALAADGDNVINHAEARAGVTLSGSVTGLAAGGLASVPCQRLAPDADSFHALALRRLIKPPITEEEIAAKEKDIKRLRVRLGLSSWCKRYAGQMEQARILVQASARPGRRQARDRLR